MADTVKPANAPVAKPAANTQEVHNVSEYVSAAAKVFGKDVRPYAVEAAFRHAKKESATEEEAKKIVNDFRNHKVV